MIAMANKKSEYGELIEFLTDQFFKIEENFRKIDERFDKVDERFDKVDERFNKIDERLDRLENGQDHILGELQKLQLENTVGVHRSHRMEEWIIKASKKIYVPYKP